MLDYNNPKLIIETNKLEEGIVTWRSPSNIAIIKYWGKHGVQLPRNPSISLTLDAAFTETKIHYQPKTGVDTGLDLEFYFHGKPNDLFKAKVEKFLKSLLEIFPFLKQLKLRIESANSFPHSAGIASSASSMSALALCLCSLEDKLFGTLDSNEEFRKKASFISRLGSGSACRSIYSGLAVWGKFGEVENSSDLFAIPFEDQVDEVYSSLHDDILLISSAEKSVSSRAGHGLMDENIFAENRYQQARQRFHELLIALKSGDIEQFGRITESEALTLHALMMTSNPSFILMKPNTLAAIERIKSYRKETGDPIYFSLDAGPNLHLLYPDNISEKIKPFIESELVPFCENQKWLQDSVGKGPIEL